MQNEGRGGGKGKFKAGTWGYCDYLLDVGQLDHVVNSWLSVRKFSGGQGYKVAQKVQSKMRVGKGAIMASPPHTAIVLRFAS